MGRLRKDSRSEFPLQVPSPWTSFCIHVSIEVLWLTPNHGQTLQDGGANIPSNVGVGKIGSVQETDGGHQSSNCYVSPVHFVDNLAYLALIDIFVNSICRFNLIDRGILLDLRLQDAYGSRHCSEAGALASSLVLVGGLGEQTVVFLGGDNAARSSRQHFGKSLCPCHAPPRYLCSPAVSILTKAACVGFSHGATGKRKSGDPRGEGWADKAPHHDGIADSDRNTPKSAEAHHGRTSPGDSIGFLHGFGSVRMGR